MARFYSFFIFLFVVFLSLANADLRIRRSPQFSQASASAGSFDNYPRGFGGPNFGPQRPRGFGPQFGGPSPVLGPQFGGRSPIFGPQYGGRPPVFGPPGFGNSGFGRPGSGPSINIAKSISISSGGGGGGARSSAGGYGK